MALTDQMKTSSRRRIKVTRHESGRQSTSSPVGPICSEHQPRQQICLRAVVWVMVEELGSADWAMTMTSRRIPPVASLHNGRCFSQLRSPPLLSLVTLKQNCTENARARESTRARHLPQCGLSSCFNRMNFGKAHASS